MDNSKRPARPSYDSHNDNRERIRNRSNSPDNQRHQKYASEKTKMQPSETRWDDPINKFSDNYKPEKAPKYRAPPNRFNILPGKQWDGIDRSNGFEKAYFKKLAQQNIKKDLDYKYTVADM